MNKEFLASLFFTILLMTGCKAESENSEKNLQQETEQTEKIENDILNITYNQKVNGYKVKVIWKPQTIKYRNAVGPAIIEFKKGETEFSLTNNYFYLPTKTVDLKIIENKVVGINKSDVNLDYKKPIIGNGSFESIDVPFVFLDLDFDEIKELILTKANQGPRFSHAYDAYSFSEYGKLERSQITNQEPFNEIDFMTKLNKENKELVINFSGGICSGTTKTYGLNKGEFSLTGIVRMERNMDTGKCYEFVYKIIDGKEELISKEKVEQ